MTENGKNFLEILSADRELQNKIQGLNKEQVFALIREYGFELTADDLELKSPESHTLDTKELEYINGGSICVCVIGGGGAATRKDQQTCACVAGGFGFVSVGGVDYSYMRCACPAAGGGNDKDGDEAWAECHTR